MNQRIQKWKGSLRQVSVTNINIKLTARVRIQISLNPSQQMNIQMINRSDLKAKTEE